MKITTEEVIHVAGLARLQIERDDLERFAEQLGVILDYVESLKDVDTTGVEPTAHAVSTTNAFRNDENHLSIDNQEALSGAPASENGFFVVPRIID